jgi:uncharacterized protein YjbI with pentapeptide repeats
MRRHVPGVICLVFCSLVLGVLLACRAQGAPGKLTPAEEYVRQQAAKGEWVDLQKKFGDQENDRTLSARFLKDLLTGAYQVHWNWVRIKNAVINEPLDLERARIPYAVELTFCQFRRKVICWDAEFDQSLNLNGSHFGQGADFSLLSVGQFIATGARFDGKTEFSCLEVGQDAFFDKATFTGPVDFSSARIRGQFSADGARFESTLYFLGVKVGQDACFDAAIFKGPVDFVGANIGGQFVAQGARFEGAQNKAEFNGLKVGRSAIFDKATFKGPVDFAPADIGGQFSANGARFESTAHKANFGDMQVGQGAFFLDVTCRSEVYLTYGSFLDLRFQGVNEVKQDEASSPMTLHLTGTQVKRKLIVTNLDLKSLEARRLQVNGTATFAGLNIKEKADFQKAALENLEFSGITWPEKGENLKLDGLTYNSICVDGPDNFAGALNLVERSAFNLQNYVQLEKYCQRRGHQDWADTVTIALKNRALEHWPWYIRWLISDSYRKLISYWRKYKGIEP